MEFKLKGGVISKMWPMSEKTIQNSEERMAADEKFFSDVVL